MQQVMSALAQVRISFPASVAEKAKEVEEIAIRDAGGLKTIQDL